MLIYRNIILMSITQKHKDYDAIFICSTDCSSCSVSNNCPINNSKNVDMEDLFIESANTKHSIIRNKNSKSNRKIKVRNKFLKDRINSSINQEIILPKLSELDDIKKIEDNTKDEIKTPVIDCNKVDQNIEIQDLSQNISSSYLNTDSSLQKDIEIIIKDDKQVLKSPKILDIIDSDSSEKINSKSMQDIKCNDNIDTNINNVTSCSKELVASNILQNTESEHFSDNEFDKDDKVIINTKQSFISCARLFDNFISYIYRNIQNNKNACYDMLHANYLKKISDNIDKYLLKKCKSIIKIFQIDMFNLFMSRFAMHTSTFLTIKK